jgi:hypothetical protein
MNEQLDRFGDVLGRTKGWRRWRNGKPDPDPIYDAETKRLLAAKKARAIAADTPAEPEPRTDLDRRVSGRSWEPRRPVCYPSVCLLDLVERYA